MQQRFKQHTALTLGAAGVVMVLAGGFFLFRGGGDAGRLDPGQSRPLSAPTLPSARTDLSQNSYHGQWDYIRTELRSDDPATRSKAADALRGLAQTTPDALIDQMQHWIKPLVEAELWPQILALTPTGIVKHAAQTNLVADQQLARAQAMLALGRPREALAEAKSAFNVMPQKLVGRAIDTLAQTLTEQPGSAEALLVQRFRQYQVTASNPNFKPPSSLELVEAPDNVLANVRVDPALYEEGLARLASDTSYDGLMGRGNLLLLADRPEEAMQVFLQAAADPGLKGKKLWGPLEGVVRARRARVGGIGPGNASILAMKFGATASSYLSEISDLNLPINQLHDAGRGIPLANLPDSLQAEAKSAGIDAGKLDLLGRMDHVIAVVRDANPSDPELVTWLDRMAKHSAVGPELQIELRGILDRSPLETAKLFELGKTYCLASDDLASGAIMFKSAVQRVHVILQANGRSPEGRALLRLLEQYRDDYTPVLWSRIDKHADKESLQTVATIYEDFLQWCPEDDVELSRRRPLAALSLANTYYMMRRYDEQLRILGQIERSALSDGMKKLVGYSEALGLYAKERFDEALPHFQICADWEGFASRKQAKWFVVLSLARIGRHAEAKVALREYVDSFHPNSHETMTLTGEIDRLAGPH